MLYVDLNIKYLVSINVVEILIMSVKLVTPSLLRITVVLNKGYENII